MMKSVVFFLASVAASAAMAFPAVKDAVTFNGTFTQGISAPVPFQQSMEVTALDAATDVYTVNISFTLPTGQIQTQDQQVAGADMYTSAVAQQYLAQCVSGGGTLEDVVVPAGTYKTCAVPTERGGVVYLGDVPFAIVKEISFDEQMNKIVLELATVVNGQ